jgi:hypothetical protein
LNNYQTSISLRVTPRSNGRQLKETEWRLRAFVKTLQTTHKNMPLVDKSTFLL